MDFDFQHYMRDIDLVQPPDMFLREYPTILVANPMVFKHGFMQGEIVESPMPSSAKYPQSYWNGIKTTGKMVIFPCDPEIQIPIQSCSLAVLAHFQIGFATAEIPTNWTALKSTDRSMIVPWYKNMSPWYTMIDWCCGGYGGWSYAAEIAAEINWPFHYIIAVDSSLEAVTQHALNHDTVLMPDTPLQPDWFLREPKHVTIQGDIKKLDALPAIAMTGSQLWTFSFPCQPWSKSGSANGMYDDNGRVFGKGMTLARLMRPKVICLENVAGFPEHPQYPEMIKFIHWCGYRIVHQGTWDTQDRLPIRRPRWLAILIRIEDFESEKHWIPWEFVEDATPSTWGAKIISSIPEAAFFSPTKVQMAKYLDPAYVPTATTNQKQNMMSFRTCAGKSKLPVFMANYGRHHELPELHLRNKGLMGHFTFEHDFVRCWKPLEVALFQVQQKPLILLRPQELAWKHLGNAIVIHHALCHCCVHFH